MSRLFVVFFLYILYYKLCKNATLLFENGVQSSELDSTNLPGPLRMITLVHSNI
jgi:hypothetical protein